MGSAAGLGLWREIVALPRFWAGAIASFDDAWHANSGPDGEAGRAVHEECALARQSSDLAPVLAHCAPSP